MDGLFLAAGECYICLNGLEQAKGVELICGHGFDKACLEKWLVDHNTCPVCRKKVDDPPAQSQPYQPQSYLDETD